MRENKHEQRLYLAFCLFLFSKGKQSPRLEEGEGVRGQVESSGK